MGVHGASPAEKSPLVNEVSGRGDREKMTNPKDLVQQTSDVHRGVVLAVPNVMSTEC